MRTTSSAGTGGPMLQRQQLPGEVAGYVREQIMSGNLRPGDFLRMEPIAEAVGVSITPVREGLLSLSSEGFVNAIPRRGYVVAEFTRQDVRDLFWAQSKLAGELAARAAKLITPEDLEKLADVMQQCDDAIAQNDAEGTGRFGHEFHRIINLAADSDRLSRILSSVVKNLPNAFYASIEAHVDSVENDHPQLLEALRKRKPEQARKIAEAHTINSADHVIEMLESRGLWKDDEA